MESMQTPALLNRHNRRRNKALARQRAKQARRRRTALPTALLASATIGILATANLKDAQAQVVLNPPGAIPAQCTVTGGTAVCEGNLSAGLDADGPPLNTLSVQNLTAAITPAANLDGIAFDYAGNGNVSLTVNTGAFGITTAGAGALPDGIQVTVSGNGSITINQTGNISAGDDGIFAEPVGNGDIRITSAGNIVAGNNGYTYADGMFADAETGNVTITSTGSIVANDDGFDAGSDNGNVTITSRGDITALGISVTSHGVASRISGDGTITIDSIGTIAAANDGLRGNHYGNGIVSIISVGNISTRRDDGEGIYTRIRGNGDITISSMGDVTTQGSNSEAIYADVDGNGNINITSAGDITTTGNNADGIYANGAGNGSVTINVTGNVTASDDGIDVFEFGVGDITVTVVGDVMATGSTGNPDGFDIDESDDGNVILNIFGDVVANDDGIDINESGVGDIIVTVVGDVAATGITVSPDGFDINEDDDGDIILKIFGDVVANDDVLDITESGNGSIVITSVGNRTTTFGDDDGFDVTESGVGSITINSTGNLTIADGPFDVNEYGDGDIFIRSTGDIVSGLAGNGSGDAFDVSERGDGNLTIISVGDITTSGDPGADGFEIDESGPGGIAITSTGNITATGTNADGLQLSNDAPSVNTITLIDGVVTGGSGTGAAINLNDPGFAGPTIGTNTINTMGTVTLSSLAGTAVNDGDADTTINNFGILNTVSNGAIQLGGGTNAFNNMGGAIFNSGGIVNLGAGNLFSNSGTLSPGASGSIQTTAITGNLVQNGGGIFLASVNPSAGTGDLVTVNGTANLAGIVQAEVVDPVTGTRSVTILSAAGGTTNNGLGLLASPALQASLSFPNANDVVLSYSIDFSAGGLNPNQTALANGLNAAANTGTRDLDPVLLPLLNNVFTIGDYRNALNQLLPEVVLNTGTATLFASEGFVDNLFSCRLAGQNHTAVSEGECYWARPQGRFLDRDSDANTIGFDETSGGLAAGAQVAVAPNWFAGFALGYERASLDTDTGAETDSNRFSGGLSLKYQAGSFLLGAAISGGVSGNDTQRPISIGGAGGFNATAESNYAIKTLTGQARAAYVFQFRDWFAKPLVDVTATYLSRDSVTESGAGAANLVLSGSDDTFFSITPALEIGGDFALSETSTLRPYVRAGVSFYTDSDHGLTASFVNAPAGTSAFSITSDFDDVFADVAAGATAFFDNGSTLGLAYEGLISSDTQQHGISLKGTIAF